MSKYKILVPTDGSDFGRQIFPQIRKYISPERNELILLRVGKPQTGYAGARTGVAGLQSSATANLSGQDFEQAAHPIYASQERASAAAEFRSELQAELHEIEQSGYTVHLEVRFGKHRGQAIVNYVNNNPVDMVAMTTHWRASLTRFIFGNTVRYIAPRIKVPIFLMRPVEE